MNSIISRPRILFISLVLISLLCLCAPVGAIAPTKPGKGLSISPVTKFTAINATSQQTGGFTVGNFTANPITVNLTVKQFSVNDYSYTYNFNPPANDWVTLGKTQIQLAPSASQVIPYSINVPAGAPPGGNYYTFLASTTQASGSIKSTAQAASLLYLTVNGKLIHSSKLQSASIQHIVFGTQTAYHFDVINTGNVYYFIYISGQLHGLTAAPAVTPVTHLVYQGKIRQFTGTIPHPLLPGIYRVTYGYTTDTGSSQQESSLILYIPPWSIAGFLAVLLILNKWYAKRK